MNTQIAQLSPAQVNILDMMSFIKTPKAIDELNEFLSNYFSKKLDEEIDKLWADGSLNENKIEDDKNVKAISSTFPESFESFSGNLK